MNAHRAEDATLHERQHQGVAIDETDAETSLDVVITIQHPAHVHFFRNAIEELDARGHDVHVFAREKDIASDLLESYGIDHEIIAGQASTLPGKALVQAVYEWRLFRRARQIGPDVMLAIGEPGVVHVSSLLGCRSVVFTDTEHATHRKRFVYPMADRVCSPEFYQDDIGDNHTKYPGYHELAYLHPDRFDPDASVLDDLDVGPDERLVVLRLVSWDAAHDIGDRGIDDAVDAVERLEAEGARVVITSEADLPPELADRELSLPADRIHDLLYHADLFIGESATMATESAVLGTPGILISTIEGIGNIRELRDEYGLVFSYAGERRHERGIQKAVSVLDGDVNGRWAQRRERLLADKIDTTTFVTALVEDDEVGVDAFQDPTAPDP
jgi:predicted glycosyltransferase